MRDLQERKIAAPAGPVRAFIPAPDVALEVHTEHVESGRGSQRRERDLDFRRPSVSGDPRFGPPPFVPRGVDAVTFVCDQGVVLRAERIDAK